VACFQNEADAKRFREGMEERFQQFHLEIAPEKTKRLKFGMFALIKSKSQRGESQLFSFQ
jgi:cyclophilin family peptidyl-prolyl cis-trans isomerase